MFVKMTFTHISHDFELAISHVMLPNNVKLDFSGEGEWLLFAVNSEVFEFFDSQLKVTLPNFFWGYQ